MERATWYRGSAIFIDLNNVDTDPFTGKHFDVCICGGGVAGITLAVYLARDLSVALLEAGGREATVNSQEIYAGDIVGREYFDLRATRQRFFGGTSNHWSGWCLPLDEHDFEAVTYFDFSGWPISRSDLDSYYLEARSILDIPPDPRNSPNDAEAMLDRICRFGSDFNQINFLWSPPTRFASKYEAEISSRDNVTCFLNANVTNLRLADDLSAVSNMEVSDWRNRQYSVHADRFVVATGGLENPRLLLASNSQIPTGIGNQNDLVGRFFAEHPHHSLGNLIFEDRVRDSILKHWLRDNRRFYSPTRQMMRRERILNGSVRIEPWKPPDISIFRRAAKGVVCAFDWSIEAAQSATGNIMACAQGNLRGGFEQAPNPASRVSLSRETDRFGMPRIVLDWQLLEIDIRTMRQFALRFGEALAVNDVGRLQVREWLLTPGAEPPGFGEDEVAGHHHMCTTRMADDERHGVVDANQRVFGIDNLYVAGSSVFGTGGHANPTFTIVQMTLRLADHLSRHGN